MLDDLETRFQATRVQPMQVEDDGDRQERLRAGRVAERQRDAAAAMIRNQQIIERASARDQDQIMKDAMAKRARIPGGSQALQLMDMAGQLQAKRPKFGLNESDNATAALGAGQIQQGSAAWMTQHDPDQTQQERVQAELIQEHAKQFQLLKRYQLDRFEPAELHQKGVEQVQKLLQIFGGAQYGRSSVDVTVDGDFDTSIRVVNSYVSDAHAQIKHLMSDDVKIEVFGTGGYDEMQRHTGNLTRFSALLQAATSSWQGLDVEAKNVAFKIHDLWNIYAMLLWFQGAEFFKDIPTNRTDSPRETDDWAKRDGDDADTTNRFLWHTRRVLSIILGAASDDGSGSSSAQDQQVGKVPQGIRDDPAYGPGRTARAETLFSPTSSGLRIQALSGAGDTRRAVFGNLGDAVGDWGAIRTWNELHELALNELMRMSWVDYQQLCQKVYDLLVAERDRYFATVLQLERQEAAVHSLSNEVDAAKSRIADTDAKRLGSTEHERRKLLLGAVRCAAFKREGVLALRMGGESEDTLDWQGSRYYKPSAIQAGEEEAVGAAEVCAYEALIWYMTREPGPDLLMSKERTKIADMIGESMFAIEDPKNPVARTADQVQHAKRTLGMRSMCLYLDSIILCTREVPSEQMKSGTVQVAPVTGQPVVNLDAGNATPSPAAGAELQAAGIRAEDRAEHDRILDDIGKSKLRRSLEWNKANSLLTNHSFRYMSAVVKAGKHDVHFLRFDKEEKSIKNLKDTALYTALSQLQFNMPGTGREASVEPPNSWSTAIALSKVWSLVEELCMSLTDSMLIKEHNGATTADSRDSTYEPRSAVDELLRSRVFQRTYEKQRVATDSGGTTYNVTMVNPLQHTLNVNLSLQEEYQDRIKEGKTFEHTKSIYNVFPSAGQPDAFLKEPRAGAANDSGAWTVAMELEANPHALALWVVLLHRLLTVQYLSEDVLKNMLDRTSQYTKETNSEIFEVVGTMGPVFTYKDDAEPTDAELISMGFPVGDAAFDAHKQAAKDAVKSARADEKTDGVPNLVELWILKHPAVVEFKNTHLGKYMMRIYETALKAWFVRESRVLELATVWSIDHMTRYQKPGVGVAGLQDTERELLQRLKRFSALNKVPLTVIPATSGVTFAEAFLLALQTDDLFAAATLTREEMDSERTPAVVVTAADLYITALTKDANVKQRFVAERLWYEQIANTMIKSGHVMLQMMRVYGPGCIDTCRDILLRMGANPATTSASLAVMTGLIKTFGGETGTQALRHVGNAVGSVAAGSAVVAVNAAKGMLETAGGAVESFLSIASDQWAPEFALFGKLLEKLGTQTSNVVSNVFTWLEGVVTSLLKLPGTAVTEAGKYVKRLAMAGFQGMCELLPRMGMLYDEAHVFVVDAATYKRGPEALRNHEGYKKLEAVIKAAGNDGRMIKWLVVNTVTDPAYLERDLSEEPGTMATIIGLAANSGENHVEFYDMTTLLPALYATLTRYYRDFQRQATDFKQAADDFMTKKSTEVFKNAADFKQATYVYLTKIKNAMEKWSVDLWRKIKDSSMFQTLEGLWLAPTQAVVAGIRTMVYEATFFGTFAWSTAVAAAAAGVHDGTAAKIGQNTGEAASWMYSTFIRAPIGAAASWFGSFMPGAAAGASSEPTETPHTSSGHGSARAEGFTTDYAPGETVLDAADETLRTDAPPRWADDLLSDQQWQKWFKGFPSAAEAVCAFLIGAFVWKRGSRWQGLRPEAQTKIQGLVARGAEEADDVDWGAR